MTEANCNSKSGDGDYRCYATCMVTPARTMANADDPGEAAIADGREYPFKLIGTKGAEAVTRTSVREAEMAGADSRAVAKAWAHYSDTKCTDPLTRRR